MAKILFVSSKGGHFAELMQLKPIMDLHETTIVCEKGSNSKICDFQLTSGSRKNKIKYLLVFIANFFQTCYILLKVRPNVIISTGAHSCFHFFLLAKIFRIKSIYIESFARFNQLSLTYRLVKKMASVKVVQHHELLALAPDAKYIGRIF